jgi:hypothetical protein
MKKLSGVLALLLLAWPLLGQTNLPIRLALVAESADAAPAVDLLTAQLSGDNRVQLLERDEIARVYHEQSMSAANRDDIKLGRILGADGLLLLQTTPPPHVVHPITSSGGQPCGTLTIRLIAVKPGVILADSDFSWPLTNATQWAQSAIPYLDFFFTKLAISADDAIPLSVVNLHSAIQSADALDTEHQLKLLAIQRLSQEPQFFILERQKMDLLSEEKDLKSDETPFWDGSYLLDGIVDQNGYSQDTLTIDAKLTPSKGGIPLSFEVSGSRTNLAEVINALALKVDALLKVNPTVKQWDAASEASQYFNEANWALKWGIYREAEAAADSAWALGKQDLDCALVRVKAYVEDTSSHVEKFALGGNCQRGVIYISPEESGAQVKEDVDYVAASSLVTKFKKKLDEIDYSAMNSPPDPNNIDSALQTLGMFIQISRSSVGRTLQNNPEWYDLGISDLIVASEVLRNFIFFPASQMAVSDKLADLRASARSAATLISRFPAPLRSGFEENPADIFDCEVRWGCFWQETPEDEIEFYHLLMGDTRFPNFHEGLWFRPADIPRLAAWNDADRMRLDTVWRNFQEELASSTNAVFRVENRALQLCDATNAEKAFIAVTNFYETLFQVRFSLVTNHIDWPIGQLTEAIGADCSPAGEDGGVFNLEYEETPQRTALEKLCADYSVKLRAVDDECHKVFKEQTNTVIFEEQKQYLIAKKPFDSGQSAQYFAQLFIIGFHDYSKAQATEIKPLLEGYKTDLNEQIKNLSRTEPGWQRIGVLQISQVQRQVDDILNPRSQPAIALQPKIVKIEVSATLATNQPETVTNVTVVDKSFIIPAGRLIDLDSSKKIDPQSLVTVTAHHWFDGKLLLNFDYNAQIYLLDGGRITGAYLQAGAGIAILNPATGEWQVVACPDAGFLSQNLFYHRSALLNGRLFSCDDNQIREYDFAMKQWHPLKISDGNKYEIFAINGHLYAANGSIIFEITDDGTGTRILASTRRRPAVSALDNLDSFGTPTLFAGTNQILQACVGGTIYRWDQNDWRVKDKLPYSDIQPQTFPPGLLLRARRSGRGGDFADGLFRYQKGALNLCLWQKFHYLNDGHTYLPVPDTQAPPSLWQMPSKFIFSSMAATLGQSNLYLLADARTNADHAYNAELFCFSDDLPFPRKLFLKFDSNDVPPPLANLDPTKPQIFPSFSQSWITSVNGKLFVGLEYPRDFGRPSNLGSGMDKTAIWQLPLPALASSMSSQRQAQLAQLAQEKAAEKKACDDFLAQFDRNHNGTIDPDEKEEAVDNPAFIKPELDKIDTNHDGWLEAGELVYFDANHNQILDPKEQAGVDIAQHLLAIRLMNKYDLSGKGYLTPGEFSDLQKLLESNDAASHFMFPYRVYDVRQNVDVQYVENFLKGLTSQSFDLPGAVNAKIARALSPAGAMPSGPGVGEFYKSNREQIFKLEVEYYWQNSHGHSN